MPATRGRSSSRSRTTVVEEKKMKSPVAARSRSRGRPSKKEKAAELRKASKSATPKKTTTTRQRSSSRGRPSTTKKVAAEKVKKTPKKTPKVATKSPQVEKTTETADDDEEEEEEEVIRTPRLRSRVVRDLTQEQPVQRPKTPKTFPETVAQVSPIGGAPTLRQKLVALLTLIFITPFTTLLHIWIQFWTTRNSADKKKTLFLIGFAVFLLITYVASRVNPRGVDHVSYKIRVFLAPVYDTFRGSIFRTFHWTTQKIHKYFGPTLASWGIGPA